VKRTLPRRAVLRDALLGCWQARVPCALLQRACHVRCCSARAAMGCGVLKTALKKKEN
jgi:hypothetical protein